ncbi:dolichyl-phosphate beta-glucosyltransferase [Streptomyces hyaluromycini]|uniref:dolichyl-phosphate beta-glucosyltransferase n=1 Tax=Streptomyces hyaluromycini TaxID=1377993 RepID=UPI000B5CC5C8|nr:dolichyl-phosphate beta-glucosyltransferase [Streptomyces hyaluromycini]
MNHPRATLPVPAPPSPTHHDEPVLDLAVPVFNEEADLEPSVRRLHAYLRETFPYPFRITVADNASTDATPLIAARLAAELPEVEWIRLAEKGRGRALRAVWSASTAPVVGYLDVDLSTGLAALLPLVAPLLSGHSDLAIGTRLAPGARVVRGPKREAISRCYNVLLRCTLSVGFSDAQCGFKAVRRDAAARLLPLVRDSAWFFDTELLVVAERAGLRIHEVPVDWVDDPDSRVALVSTALADLRGIARVALSPARGAKPAGPGALPSGRGALPSGRPPRPYVVPAAVMALAHLLLYAALRPAAAAQVANALSLLACWTLALPVRGRLPRPAPPALAARLALTAGSLAVLRHTVPAAGLRAELAALATAHLSLVLARSAFGRRGRRTESTAS